MQLGFLGGTGQEGKGLSSRFALAGVSVVIGSRSRERAVETAHRYNASLGTDRIRGMLNEEMLAECGLVVLTVPSDQIVGAIEAVRNHLRKGQVLVDVTVPMRFRNGRAEYLENEAGSNSELLLKYLPEGVELVAAFKTLPAHILEEHTTDLDCDVFVCGNSEQAKNSVSELVSLLPGVRALDAGNLMTARTLERMTVLAVNLNRKYRKKGARYRVQGL